MSPNQPLRLVKILMPADVVRQMDHTILAAVGAYQGRADFITEAVRDRVAEEAAMRSASATREPTSGEQGVSNLVAFGAWIELKPPTVPAVRTEAVSFGLHNRDLPSLWAFDQLLQAAARSGGPVSWAEFVAQIGRASLALGEGLRLRDLGRERGIAAGTGFPKPGAKQTQSVERFVGAMVGSLKRGDGPLFDLGLAVREADIAVAPTSPGTVALGEMVEGGLAAELPQPEPAARAWWRHLRAWAPAEHAAWQRVLLTVAEAPTRDELVTRFPEWPGSTADTNTSGFVSRSREWGLVLPELIDNRYRLTALGEDFLRQE